MSFAAWMSWERARSSTEGYIVSIETGMPEPSISLRAAESRSASVASLTFGDNGAVLRAPDIDNLSPSRTISSARARMDPGPT